MRNAFEFEKTNFFCFIKCLLHNFHSSPNTDFLLGEIFLKKGNDQPETTMQHDSSRSLSQSVIDLVTYCAICETYLLLKCSHFCACFFYSSCFIINSIYANVVWFHQKFLLFHRSFLLLCLNLRTAVLKNR